MVGAHGKKPKEATVRERDSVLLPFSLSDAEKKTKNMMYSVRD